MAFDHRVTWQASGEMVDLFADSLEGARWRNCGKTKANGIHHHEDRQPIKVSAV